MTHQKNAPSTPRGRPAGSRSRRGKDMAGQPIHLKSVSDRLILEAVGELIGPEVLVILLQGTTLATGLRQARPDLKFTFYTPEHYFFSTLREFHPDAEVARGELTPDPVEDVESLPVSDSGSMPQVASASSPPEFIPPASGHSPASESTNPVIHCAADPPGREYDSIVFPTNAMGTAEQTQEMLQIAILRLRPGGRLLVSTNNPKDKWLHEQLRLYNKVTVSSHRDGVVYIVRRSEPLKRIRDFRATFAFRLHERLVTLHSRPGVFCHRRLDVGARALIRSLDLLRDDSGNPVDGFVPHRIIDLGCGCGAVAVAAALLYAESRVLAVDSHARAVECATASAAANGIDRIDVLLASDAVLPNPNSWDLMLTNPPYYSDFRISELFLQSAKTSLRPGGRLHVVTKLTDWHQARMNQLFRDVTVHDIGEYNVLTARKK